MTRASIIMTIFVSCAIPAFAQQAVSPGTGAVLRVLDKVSGQSTNYEVARGQSQAFGQLSVAVRECRFPEGNPTGEAYAYLDVTAENGATQVFSGWMVASSPALNAMEHARYDVWVLRCKTS